MVVLIVWLNPTWAPVSVPSWSLNTLSLELAASTFNILTFSCLVPIPTFKISFSLKLRLLRLALGDASLPWTLKNVTNPVAATDPIPSDTNNLEDLIPTLKVLPPSWELVVVIPEIKILSPFCMPNGVVWIPTNLPLSSEG